MVTDDSFFAPYTEGFFALHHDEDHARAYREIARTIFAEFNPQSVIDVGCGTGNLLSEIQYWDHSVDIRGIEAPQSQARIRNAGMRIAPEFYDWVDLRSIGQLEYRRYDLAISVEVAEHLPEESAEGYVKFLCSLSDTVLFSAARPGQGGTGHINEQPIEWWSALFAENGFALDPTATRRIQFKLTGNVGRCTWYERLFVFRRLP